MNFFEHHSSGDFLRGFGLVEIVLAIGIITMSLYAVSGVARSSLELNRRVLEGLQAQFLAEESAEALRFLRNKNWTEITSLTVDIPYFMSFATTTWPLSTATTSINGFYRTIVVSNVNRDTNDRITLSGGTLDQGTKKIIITVSWWGGIATTSRSVTLYLTDLL